LPDLTQKLYLFAVSARPRLITPPRVDIRALKKLPAFDARHAVSRLSILPLHRAWSGDRQRTSPRTIMPVAGVHSNLWNDGLIGTVHELSRPRRCGLPGFVASVDEICAEFRRQQSAHAKRISNSNWLMTEQCCSSFVPCTAHCAPSPSNGELRQRGYRRLASV
jgi:hypothetical protein